MRPRMVVNVVVLVVMFVIALYATAYAAPYGRGCQQCLDSGTNPWICYLTYGAGCL